MKVSDVSQSEFVQRARTGGIWLQTGPFRTHLQTRIPFIARAVHLLYGDFPLAESPEFADFHVRLDRPRGLRRWYHPQVLFYLDDDRPFAPLPLHHGFAMFEWCLNWCIETYAHHYVIIHAAVIERHGNAAVLAAPPGSGKSTLTAGLVSRGWRLLSDELTLLDPTTGFAVPIGRPIGLKNESIQVIREFAPDAVIGPVATDTIKGTVAHLKAPADSVRRMNEPAKPRWVIFPRFAAGEPPVMTPHPKGTALLRLADNSFNYSYLGVDGFTLLSDLIDGCDCYQFTYGRLEDAIVAFDALSTPSTAKGGAG